MLLLDIEKELCGPDGEAALQRYDEVLKNLDERLAVALSEGLPPNEYSNAEQLKKVVPLARKVLRRVAKGRQGRNSK